MQIKRIALGLALLHILPSLVYAQSIEGLILDKVTGKSIQGALLEIEGIPYSIRSKKDGSFQWGPQEAKVYKLTFSHPLYQSRTKEVVLKKDKRYSLGIALEPMEMNRHEVRVFSMNQKLESLKRIPMSLGHVQQKEILRRNARTTPELLMGEPGVWVSKSHHAGGNIHLRGLTGNRILTTIDGIRMNQGLYPSSPHAYLNLVDMYSLDHIDIQKSRGSTRFGSDAMGGTLALFTKNPHFSNKGLTVDAQALYKLMSNGMESTGRGELMLSTTSFALTGGYSNKSFGDVITSNEGTSSIEGSGYDEQAGNLKAQLRIGDKHLFTFAHNFVNQENAIRHDLVTSGQYTAYDVDPKRSLTYARFTALPGGKWINKWEITTSFQNFEEERSVQLSGTTEFLEQVEEIKTYGAQLELFSKPGSYWNAVSGLSYYQDDIEARGTPIDGARSSHLSVYSIHTVDLLKLRLSLGGRAALHNLEKEDAVFGDLSFRPPAVTGHLTAMYPLDRFNNLFASINTGYHGPSIYDVGQIGAFDTGIEVPNDSLSIERALTTEIGLKSKTEHFSGSVVVYRTRLSQLLERVAGQYLGQTTYLGLPVFRNDNIGTAAVQGIEAELEVPLANTLSFYGNVNYTLGFTLSNSEPLSYIPPLNGKLGLMYRNPRGFWGRAEWFYASQQTDLSPTEINNPLIPAGGTPGWNMLNVLAGYDFTWFSLAAGLQNVLDESYILHGSNMYGYGFSFWLTFKLKV